MFIYSMYCLVGIFQTHGSEINLEMIEHHWANYLVFEKAVLLRYRFSVLLKHFIDVCFTKFNELMDSKQLTIQWYLAQTLAISVSTLVVQG